MNFIYAEIIHGFDKGKLIPIKDGANSLGRSINNSIVFDSREKIISNHHALIYKIPGKILFQDLNSTNGSYVNDVNVNEIEINNGDIISFGKSGPRLRLIVSDSELPLSNPVAVNIGFFDQITAPEEKQSSILKHNEEHYFQTKNSLVTDSSSSKSNYRIVNDFITDKIIYNFKFQFMSISIFLVLLLFISFFPFTPIRHDHHNNPNVSTAAVQKMFLNYYNNELVLKDYISPQKSELTFKIKDILTKFGEHDYNIPEEMVERVQFYVELFSGDMKPLIGKFTKRKHELLPLIQKILEENNLPKELAYISMLESGFNPYAKSNAGAYGIWQFMANTARRYGLIVNDTVDQRTDTEKATYAAAAYFKELIALYGGKSSVMIAMAAYNAGEGKVNSALRKIEDPLKNRDFWYIYRKGYLPKETNEYIPKIIALIIICENKI